MEFNQPMLMLDSSTKDGKAEIVMDYVLSWCLRCTESECCPEKTELKKKCKYLLSKLLNMPLELATINSVKVWKEWEHIDLRVEVQLTNGNLETENHAILIENKYYTGLKLSKDTDGEWRNQLIVYKKKFDNLYIRERDYDACKLHYNIISCIYRTDPKFEELFGCVGNGDYKDFHIFSLNELIPDSKFTESDIYNEFMLTDWC